MIGDLLSHYNASLPCGAEAHRRFGELKVSCSSSVPPPVHRHSFGELGKVSVWSPCKEVSRADLLLCLPVVSRPEGLVNMGQPGPALAALQQNQRYHRISYFRPKLFLQVLILGWGFCCLEQVPFPSLA